MSETASEVASAVSHASVQSTMLDNLSKLTILRQMGIMVGLAASVALGFAVVLWSRQPSYQTLVTQPDSQAAAQIGALLEQAHIEYRLDPDSGVIMVDQQHLVEAKLKLASSGLMPKPNPGYELLDSSQFGTSQFMETARYYRAVEGELGRTIAAMAGVQEARVHLAIPKHSVFVEDDQRSSASVFVQLLPGKNLDRSQVAAMVHLVAASVPGMRAQDVTLVDQNGQLLSNDINDPAAMMSSHQMEAQTNLEHDLQKRIDSILSPVLGLGGFHAEVSADMDFSQVEQTSENFNPNQPSLRSEQTVSEVQGPNAGTQGVPGALSNQPPPAGQVPATTNAASQPVNGAPATAAAPGSAASTAQTASTTATGSERQQATKNFELDRTISHIQQQVGTLKRISVAVVVNNVFSTAPTKSAKGKSVPVLKRVPLTPDQLNKLTLLVKDAVGFNPVRGDQVSIVNQPFIDESLLAGGPDQKIPFWQQDWFLSLSKQVLGVLVVVVLVMTVLRPIMRNLSMRPEPAASAEDAGNQGESLGDFGLSGGGEGGHDGHGKVTLTGAGGDLLLPGPHEGFESQLAAVKAMIAEDPGRVAQVVREWINAEES